MTAAPPPALGILMLDTRFPRVPGDVGNPATWPFPVRYAVVRDASPERVVRGNARGLVDAFAAAGRALASEGAAGIITTCGFLALHQRQLAQALPVPFASSSLMQLPLLARTLPAGKRPGVITIDAAALTGRHFTAVGADPATPVVGVDPAGAFARAILGDLPSLDTAGGGAGDPRGGRAAGRGTSGRGARSCSSAPTCRPTRTACAHDSVFRCTTW